MHWKYPPTSRTLACNGEAIRHLRARRGLTQAELASLAGYSRRLVAKAEAGQSVNTATIEVLCEALSTAESPVTPEELVVSPRDIARRIIEAYAKHERQCVAHCSEYLAEDLQVVAPGDPTVLPFAGDRESIDGFDDFWGAFFSVMDRPDKKIVLEHLRIVADGNEVAVLTKENCTFLGAGGQGPPIPICVLMTFEHGKLVRFEDHFNVAAVQGTVADLVDRNASVGRRLATLAR